MALDKLVDGAQLDSDLASVANAIRSKSGTSAQLAFPADFVSAVEAIETGGGSSTVKTTIWSGNAASGANITLLDDITNYDFLFITCGVSGNASFPYTMIVDTSMWNTGLATNYYGTTALESVSKYNSVAITMLSNTTICFFSFAATWGAAHMFKVVGVKL